MRHPRPGDASFTLAAAAGELDSEHGAESGHSGRGSASGDSGGKAASENSGLGGAGGARAGGVAVPATVVRDVTTTGGAVGATFTVLVVSGEGELGYTKKERTDGSFEVTLIGSGGLGLELLAGASTESGDTAVGGSGTLGIGADGKAQRTYTFDNATTKPTPTQSCSAPRSPLLGRPSAPRGRSLARRRSTQWTS